MDYRYSMRYIYLSLMAGLWPLYGYTQGSPHILNLYYPIDHAGVEAHVQRLDSLISAPGQIRKLTITGYADFLGNRAHNQSLSLRRAEAVKKYLLAGAGTQGSKIVVTTCRAEGDRHSRNNGEPGGEPEQRKVEIRLERASAENSVSRAPEHNKDTFPEAPLRLEDLAAGKSLVIEGLNFIPGRHVMVRSAEPALKKLLTSLRAHPELRIEIQGHICCVDDSNEDGLDFDTNEYRLSENRARAVYRYLVENGIAKDRLIYKGYGRTRPKIAIETTAEEEQMNRRVEIRILE